MRALLLMGPAAILAACSFSPAPLDPGGSPDSSLPVDSSIDVSVVVDAPLADVPIIDAAPPDAAIDQCSGGSTSIALSTTYTQIAAPTGTSVYTPVCGPQAATAESFYRVEVPLASVGADLVAELDDGDNWDSLLEINSDCATTAAGTCSDVGTTLMGEVVVVPTITAGRHYVIVDTFSAGTAPELGLRVWTRPLINPVGVDATCDFALVDSRCASSYCLVGGNGGEPSCVAAPTIVTDVAGNNSCSNAQAVSADAVFAGTSSDATDDDWVRLDGGADGKISFNAIAYTANGGCAADLILSYREGTDCDDDADVATDDSGGRGPCPMLSVKDGDANKLNLLRVTRHSYTSNPSVAYTLVIDYQ